jgi:hypothetical protein
MSNTSNGASVWIGILPCLKGTLVFVLLAIIAIIAITSISFLVGEVRNDGYRRMPERPFVRAF